MTCSVPPVPLRTRSLHRQIQPYVCCGRFLMVPDMGSLRISPSALPLAPELLLVDFSCSSPSPWLEVDGVSIGIGGSFSSSASTMEPWDLNYWHLSLVITLTYVYLARIDTFHRAAFLKKKKIVCPQSSPEGIPLLTILLMAFPQTWNERLTSWFFILLRLSCL